MIIRVFHIIFFSIYFMLFSPLYAFALSTELSPKEVVPGGVFLLKIQTDSNSPVEAEFLERKFDFYPLEDGYLISLIPVDIDTPPEDYKITITQGKMEQYLNVMVKSYSFPTEEITLPEEKVTLSPEDQKRVEREYLLLQEICTNDTPKAWEGEFVLPTDTAFSEEFGIKRIINKKKRSIHRGVDYKGKMGTPVKAINSGRVVLRDNLFYGGNTLIIDHGMGLFSIYMHLSKFNVSKGQEVSKGQIIGLVGDTGRVTGPHLHMSVKLKGVSVNPLALMNLKL